MNTIKEISHESALQTRILNQLQAAKVPVHVYLKTGIKIEGVITGFDAYVIILQKANIQQIMFKHAISTVVPQDPSV